ncbi:MAG TPA: TonB family protein [Saprospiraceae bacterium]|nr:TonB family protein [Saprospiraceae bacterium]
MSWNNLPVWDKNRPVFFQLGMVIALTLANIVINYQSTKPDYSDYQLEDGDAVFSASEIKTHRIASELIKKEIPIVKKVDPLIAKIVTTNQPIIAPVEIHQPKLTQSLAENTLANIVDIPKVVTEKSAPNKINNITEKMPFLTSCGSMSSEDQRRACTQNAMLDYIYKHLKYPPLALENEIEGTVIISFVVDKTGKLKDLEIVRDIGGGCGVAASKVIKGLSNWTPGYHNDNAVNVKYTIPISFKLLR